MAEFLERDALIDACHWVIRSDGTRVYVCHAEDIENAPAADVAPVRHGGWLLRHVGHGHYWECSVCHKNPCIYVTKDTNFCPNCGAKMDLEAQHD